MARLRTLSRATVTIALLLAAGSVFAETVNPSHTAPERPRASAQARVGGTAPASTTGPSRTPLAVAGPTARSLTDSQAAGLVASLRAEGVATTVAEVRAVAAKVGAGEVIHVLALSKASGTSPAQITAMRAAGKGWGEIAHDLGQSPEIGSFASDGRGRGLTKSRPVRTPKP